MSRWFLAVVCAVLLLSGAVRCNNMASISITPATGKVTVAPQWSIGGNIAGFRTMAQDLNIGGQSNDFFTLSASIIPPGGDVLAFKFYVAASGFATAHADIGSKLTPDSYSGLASADPDVGYGSVNFYFIHHRGTTDYLTVLVPGSGTASAVTDLKPMSGPGGPTTLTGISGYTELTFAAANLGYGLNMFYYLRKKPSGVTVFGSMAPPTSGSSTDLFDLGVGNYTALEFGAINVGFGDNMMYYLRDDPITGFSIFGVLNPATGAQADIANLGGVLKSLPYSPSDLGFGSGRFYTTGSFAATWQSVSFAAISNQSVSAGPFTVGPTASSGLPITLTVVSGSATISGPVGVQFTVTPTAPGDVTLQASQAGAVSPTAFQFNMLRQTFGVTGTPPPTPTVPPTTTSSVTTAAPSGPTTAAPPTTTAAPGATTAAPVTTTPATTSAPVTTLSGPPPTTPSPTAPPLGTYRMGYFSVFKTTSRITLTSEWPVAAPLAGFRPMSQDLLLGGGVNRFYSMNASTIPVGGDTTAFAYYNPLTGDVTAHGDIGSKLAPDSYSGLTSADPDVGYGPVNFYFIHHKNTTDYFSVIVPGSGASSVVSDKKPMSGPGGPGTVTGVRGYVALAFAAPNLGYGANMFYYLRRNSSTGAVVFGSLSPALSGVATDLADLGVGTYYALEFVGADIGFGVNKLYYLRLDAATGFTVAGFIDALTGVRSDVANLGGIFTTLSFAAGNLGYGINCFFVTGTFNAGWQTISFAPVGNHSASQGAFNVTPSAGSGLAMTLTVATGSTGSATISGPVLGVFTVTPTAPGLVILQATQAGSSTPSYAANMLQQRFWIASTDSRTLRIDGNFSAIMANDTAARILSLAVAADLTRVLNATVTITSVQLGPGGGLVVVFSTDVAVNTTAMGDRVAFAAGNSTWLVSTQVTYTALGATGPLVVIGLTGTPTTAPVRPTPTSGSTTSVAVVSKLLLLLLAAAMAGGL